MSTQAIIKLERQKAWIKAKAELESMLHTFGCIHEPEILKSDREREKQQFNTLSELIDVFVDRVENDGLHE